MSDHARAATPATYWHLWYRNGIAVGGAVAPTDVWWGADAGKSITVKVTRLRDGYNATQVTSAALAMP